MLMEPTALQTSTLSMSLWKSLISFGEAVCAAAQEYMTDETQRQSLLTLFHPLKQPDAEALADVAVRCYFEQPPAHIAAVNTLDHTQFVHPLLVPNICSIPVRDVLEAYPFFAFLQNIMKRGMVTSIQLSGSHSLPGLFLKGRVCMQTSLFSMDVSGCPCWMWQRLQILLKFVPKRVGISFSNKCH